MSLVASVNYFTCKWAAMAHRSRRELHRQIDAPNRNHRRRQTQAQAHLQDLADSDELPSSLIAPVGTDEVSKC